MKTVKILILVFALLTNMVYVQAYNPTVDTTLCSYNIVINDVKLHTNNSDYPILTYKNITYIPLSDAYCSFLGLNIDSSNNKCLSIKTSNVYMPYTFSTNSIENQNITAIIYTSKITINDIEFDSDQYPILSYNSIIYLPLTWDVITNILGWTYEYDIEKGLALCTNNLVPKKINSIKPNDILAANETLYYTKNGNLYAYSPSKDNVLLFEIDSSNLHYIPLFKQNGKNYLGYLLNYSTRSPEHYYRIEKTNEIKKVITRRSCFMEYNDSLILVDLFMPIFNDNLYHIKDGKHTLLGNKKCLYTRNMQLKNNWLYITGSDYKDRTFTNNLFRINLLDYSEERLNYINSSSFIIGDEYICLHNSDDQLLYIQNSYGIFPICYKKVSSYSLHNSKVYFIEKNSGKLYMHDNQNKVINILPDMNFTKLIKEGNYLIALSNYNDNPMMAILNSEDEIIFKAKQDVKIASIDQNKLYYITRDNTTYMLILPK